MELQKDITSINKNITEDDIENYIGVSKEFNVFELQTAIAQKDLAKAIRIIRYFEANPKAGPIQMILPALYNFFSKVFMIFSVPNPDEKSVATALGVNPYFVRDYLGAARKYDYSGVEKILLLLHQYNLVSTYPRPLNYRFHLHTFRMQCQFPVFPYQFLVLFLAPLFKSLNKNRISINTYTRSSFDIEY